MSSVPQFELSKGEHCRLREYLDGKPRGTKVVVNSELMRTCGDNLIDTKGNVFSLNMAPTESVLALIRTGAEVELWDRIASYETRKLTKGKHAGKSFAYMCKNNNYIDYIRVNGYSQELKDLMQYYDWFHHETLPVVVKKPRVEKISHGCLL